MFPWIFNGSPISAIANYTYSWPPGAGPSPGDKKFLGPLAMVDRLTIFTLNRQDRLSVAEGTGLCLRRLICAIDRSWYYRERQKRRQHSGAPGPLLDPGFRWFVPNFLTPSCLHCIHSVIYSSRYFYPCSDSHFPHIFKSTLRQHGNKTWKVSGYFKIG